MSDRVSGIPQDEFVAAWNAAASMVDAVRRMKEIAGGAVPRWAVMVRAVAKLAVAWRIPARETLTELTPRLESLLTRTEAALRRP